MYCVKFPCPPANGARTVSRSTDTNLILVIVGFSLVALLDDAQPTMAGYLQSHDSRRYSNTNPEHLRKTSSFVHNVVVGCGMECH